MWTVFSLRSSNTLQVTSFSNIDIMIPPTLTLCVLFLFGLEETVLSHSGHCTSNQCFAVFQEPGDFPGAQKSCKDSGGQLSVYSRELVEKTLKNQPSGQYWLGLQSITGSAANCSSVNVSVEQDFTLLSEPCHTTLNGFLCQYTFEEPCSGLQGGGGVQVKYTAPMGFQVDDSEAFPPGTTALVGTVGSKDPDLMHVCFWSDWIRTKSELICTERSCLATCVGNQCFCPDGYVLDNNINQFFCIDIDECELEVCDHKCENSFGNFRCLCDEGFKLHHDNHTCEPIKEEQQDGGSHSTPQTGCVLGIVFVALCVLLLFFLFRSPSPSWCPTPDFS